MPDMTWTMTDNDGNEIVINGIQFSPVVPIRRPDQDEPIQMVNRQTRVSPTTVTFEFNETQMPNQNNNSVSDLYHGPTGYKLSDDIITCMLELHVLQRLHTYSSFRGVGPSTRMIIRTLCPVPNGSNSRRTQQEPFYAQLQMIVAEFVGPNNERHRGTMRFAVDHSRAIYSDSLHGSHSHPALQPLPVRIYPWMIVQADATPAVQNAGALPVGFEAVATRCNCSHCGGTLEGRQLGGVPRHPWYTEGLILCRSCYNRLIANRAYCTGCHCVMEAWNGITDPQTDNLYCRTCAEETFDVCRGCGMVHPPGTLNLDPNQGHPICERCYQPEWPTGKWHATPANTFRLVPVGVTFGVELETQTCKGYQKLEGNTCWGCEHESSTEGKEFISPVLSGDEGLYEIRRFIDDNAGDWEVDQHCGTHVHLSLEGWSIDDKAKVVYAFRSLEELFTDLLPGRMRNPMCGKCCWNVADLLNAEDVEDFAMETDKFNWFNIRPLLRQNTIELRLLHGTLDADLICKWIQFIAKIVKVSVTMEWDLLRRKFNPDNCRLTMRQLFLEQFTGILESLQGLPVSIQPYEDEDDDSTYEILLDDDDNDDDDGDDDERQPLRFVVEPMSESLRFMSRLYDEL